MVTASEIDYYTNLSKIMHVTRGCRFSAAHVLRIKDLLSISTVAFLSIYLLGLSIASLAYPEVFTTRHARFYGSVGGIASAALLVISLMDFGFGRAVSAERLEQNALEISHIMRALERELASPSPKSNELKRLAVQYEELNRRTATNHTEADYKRWILRSQEPTTTLAKIQYWIATTLYDIFHFGRAMLAQLVLVLTILICTSWYSVAYLLPTLGAR